ncbi:hypothetical protein Bbelb_019610 [Branchiostoma belcheri]|nr:hypothetical protein Bbelb_019610 [Branchiostoma belcheri]
MATAKSTKQSNFSVEQESMFRRMIRKVRKGSSEDDLKVGSRTKEATSTRCKMEKRRKCDSENNMTAPGREVERMIRQLEEIRERERTEAAINIKDLEAHLVDTRQQISQKDQEIQSLNDCVAVLEAEKEEISQRDEEIQSLKAWVAVLETEKKWERTEAQDKIEDLEKRLVHQAANTQHQISEKDEEIQSLKARVAALETERKE